VYENGNINIPPSSRIKDSSIINGTVLLNNLPKASPHPCLIVNNVSKKKSGEEDINLGRTTFEKDLCIYCILTD
jgi:hypothetical protein